MILSALFALSKDSHLVWPLKGAGSFLAAVRIEFQTERITSTGQKYEEVGIH